MEKVTIILIFGKYGIKSFLLLVLGYLLNPESIVAIGNDSGMLGGGFYFLLLQ